MKASRPSRPGAARLPTMKDIARLVGVHQSTVSLALRNNPEIPPATRQRIRAAAQEIGYHPDPVLDAFNLHRLAHQPLRSAPAIAFVTDQPADATPGAVAREEAYLGAKSTAERLGYVLDRFVVEPAGVSLVRLHRILRARNIDCVIVASFSTATRELPLDWARLSGLKIDSFHVRPEFDVISSDHFRASRLAVAALRARGYGRIGLLLPESEEERLLQMPRAGYLVELDRSGGRTEPALLHLPDAERARWPALARRWITHHRLDAVVGASAEMLAVLERAGLAIPRDLAFASLERAGSRDDVAGVDAGNALVGQTAVELIAMRRRINQRSTPGETSTTFVPVCWHEGATAPDRRPAAVA